MGTRILVMSFALVGMVYSAALAQNMVTNGSFDNDVSAWYEESYVTLVWSTEDADDNLNSGSAEVTNAHPSGNNGVGISQCVATPVSEGDTYWFSGEVYILSGQATTGNAQIGLRWYDGPNCSGAFVGSQPRRTTSTIGEWVFLESGAEIAPAGAVSVYFIAFPSKLEVGGTLIAKFDNLSLLPAGIFMDGFESSTTDAWAVVMP